ncbi:hypothetical protein H9Y04_02775 [Streptomyces sp. TRM66268-LWL]|uniref:Uncharacterized protein n=1 Tax=Streptomyces polyasparticus TaxID=2767826 RepID=A0ABR7S7Q2_9ACTN|nr:hypothetical protein [Streptomyces polyasparticus]MBC9711496.1 hypothetical protein [Streptomyces polyasparticus]
MGEMAGAALTTIGAPVWLVKHMEDAARVAAHYVVGHSTATSYRLQITADHSRITVVVTDYDGQGTAGAPAWLAVGRDNTLQPNGRSPGIDALSGNSNAVDGLRLYRTPDGHVRLGCHAPWSGPSGK